MSSSDFDFEDLLDSAERIEKDATKFADGRLRKVNEFGEYEDDEDTELEDSAEYAEEELQAASLQAASLRESSRESSQAASLQAASLRESSRESSQAASLQAASLRESSRESSTETSQAESAPNQRNVLSKPQDLSNPTDRSTNRNATWLKNSVLAPTETDKEFEMFSCYVRCGGGRSVQYVSQITNVSIEKLRKVASRNNWVQRAADYDREQLSRRMAEVEGERHKLHLKKLEEYREQQETIGQQLSLSAARIAYLANRKLTNMLDSDQDLDTRDLPSLLNAASKLAEVGKNLQGGALGVDQLLAAIEESDVD